MESAMDQQFRLRWNNHPDNMTDVLVSLYHKQQLCDVTLACKGELIRAHQTVLTACSPFFEEMLLNINHPHPIIILADINLGELKAVLEFMYKGEVNVSQNLLSVFLKTAEVLRVKGLTDNNLLNDKERRAGGGVAAGELNRRSHSPAPHEKRKRKSSNCDTNSNSDSRHNDSQATSNYKSTHLPKSQSERDVGSPDDIMPPQLVKQEPQQGSPQHIDSYHSMSEALQTTRGREPPGHDGSWYGEHVDLQSVEILNFTRTLGAREPDIDVEVDVDGDLYDADEDMEHDDDDKVEVVNLMCTTPPLPLPESSEAQRRRSRKPLPMPPELDKITSARTSTSSPWQPVTKPGKRGTRFRSVWLQQYVWLKYDAMENLMFCIYCRKWSKTLHDIRTSFSAGNCNFRLEIINHHDKCKAHQTCIAKETESKKLEKESKRKT